MAEIEQSLKKKDKIVIFGQERYSSVEFSLGGFFFRGVVVAKVRRGGHEVKCRNEDDGGLIKEGWGGTEEQRL